MRTSKVAHPPRITATATATIETHSSFDMNPKRAYIIVHDALLGRSSLYKTLKSLLHVMISDHHRSNGHEHSSSPPSFCIYVRPSSRQSGDDLTEHILETLKCVSTALYQDDCRRSERHSRLKSFPWQNLYIFAAASDPFESPFACSFPIEGDTLGVCNIFLNAQDTIVMENIFSVFQLNFLQQTNEGKEEDDDDNDVACCNVLVSTPEDFIECQRESEPLPWDVRRLCYRFRNLRFSFSVVTLSSGLKITETDFNFLKLKADTCEKQCLIYTDDVKFDVARYCSTDTTDNDHTQSISNKDDKSSSLFGTGLFAHFLSLLLYFTGDGSFSILSSFFHEGPVCHIRKLTCTAVTKHEDKEHHKKTESMTTFADKKTPKKSEVLYPFAYLSYSNVATAATTTTTTTTTAATTTTTTNDERPLMPPFSNYITHHNDNEILENIEHVYNARIRPDMVSGETNESKGFGRYFVTDLSVYESLVTMTAKYYSARVSTRWSLNAIFIDVVSTCVNILILAPIITLISNAIYMLFNSSTPSRDNDDNDVVFKWSEIMRIYDTLQDLNSLMISRELFYAILMGLYRVFTICIVLIFFRLYVFLRSRGHPILFRCLGFMWPRKLQQQFLHNFTTPIHIQLKTLALLSPDKPKNINANQKITSSTPSLSTTTGITNSAFVNRCHTTFCTSDAYAIVHIWFKYFVLPLYVRDKPLTFSITVLLSNFLLMPFKVLIWCMWTPLRIIKYSLCCWCCCCHCCGRCKKQKTIVTNI